MHRQKPADPIRRELGRVTSINYTGDEHLSLQPLLKRRLWWLSQEHRRHKVAAVSIAGQGCTWVWRQQWPVASYSLRRLHPSCEGTIQLPCQLSHRCRYGRTMLFNHWMLN